MVVMAYNDRDEGGVGMKKEGGGGRIKERKSR